MQTGRLNVLIDGAWGSCGKGKAAAYLTLKHGVNVSICSNPTNAGHTVVMGEKKFVLQQLPSACVFPEVELLIDPGATITVKKILEEIETYKAQNRLTIHPNASIVTEAGVEYERENLARISSTLKGVGAALGMKVMRHPEAKLVRDVPELKPFTGDTTEKLHRFLKAGAMVLAEGAQGFDLSLNHGMSYPYVTSRDVTTASVLSNAGVPPSLVGDVYGCIRTFPIRVGHQFDSSGNKIGDSGPHYPDQIELTWDEVKWRSGSNKDLLERTTVTNKVRRVFTFSKTQFVRFLTICGPTHIFVNFANHITAGDSGVRTWSELSEETRSFVQMINDTCDEFSHASSGIQKARVRLIGTGAEMSEMVEV